MKSSVIPTAILLFATFGLVSGFDQPNIVIMMADDMGYSDTQPFGSEISTPNLQSLADSGLRMTSFYNTARCSTSRASLLSGQYSHNVGMGWLPSTNHNNQNGGTMPGYSGWFAGLDPQAPDNVPTLPEILKLASYDTYMTGKWHLTRTNTIDGGPNGSWPIERGFDKFYGTMEGAKDYFEPTWLVDSDTPDTFENVNNLPADYFYTNAISDRAAQYIRDEVADGDSSPFFLYHAFYAPHFPLQAPNDAEDSQGNNLVQKYQAIYASGWEVIRANRLASQIAMQLFPSGTQLSDPSNSDSGIPNWNSLSNSQRDEMILRMAVFAAQVEILDQGVGRILDAIRDPNNDGDTSDSIESNTLIVFISDNGAVGGGGWDGTGNISNWDNAGSAINVRYGTAWANVSDTPFRKFKSDAYEGGISSPCIVSGYSVNPVLAGSIDSINQAHIIDMMPTFMELAGASYPAEADETELEGKSLLPAFNGDLLAGRPLFFEHEGNRGAICENWKLVAPNGDDDYELYDLATDRIESVDLQQLRPGVSRDLRILWEEWAERNMAATRSQSNAGSPFLSNAEIGWLGPRLASNDRLMLHFDFDNVVYFDGSSVNDQSGNGFVGSFAADDGLNHAVDADASIPGLGNAIDLQNDYVDVYAAADIPLGRQARSFAVWFNADDVGNKRIFGYGDPSSSFLPGSLMLLTMAGEANDSLMRLRLGGTNMEFIPDVSNSIGTGQWIHAVVVIPDDAETSADIQMYINGVDVPGTLEPGDAHVDLITGLSYFTIGRRGGSSQGGTQGSSFDFDGRIADLQVYSQPLNTQQVQFLFDNPGEAIADQLLGDFNQDGMVNLLDVDGFIQALSDPESWQNENPGVNLLDIGDFNGDGGFNLLDVNGFIAALAG